MLRRVEFIAIFLDYRPSPGEGRILFKAAAVTRVGLSAFGHAKLRILTATLLTAGGETAKAGDLDWRFPLAPPRILTGTHTTIYEVSNAEGAPPTEFTPPIDAICAFASASTRAGGFPNDLISLIIRGVYWDMAAYRRGAPYVGYGELRRARKIIYRP